jgi:hypothetical protein
MQTNVIKFRCPDRIAVKETEPVQAIIDARCDDGLVYDDRILDNK